jgi:hypothetical protein
MSTKGIQFCYENNSYSYATPTGPTRENGKAENNSNTLLAGYSST